MKKIYTKSSFVYNKRKRRYELDESDSEFYLVPDDAKMSYCGAGMGGGGGGTQTTSTVEKADPWEGQQPYLKTGFQKAEDLFLNKQAPGFYPGSTVVPYSPETQLAISMQTNRAIDGSPIQQAGTNQLTQTLQGDYLNNVGDIFYNPLQQQVQSNVTTPLMGNAYQNQINDLYTSSPLASSSNAGLLNTMNGNYLYGGSGFNAAVDAAQRQINPQIDSAFEKAGRTGSGLAQQAKAQAFSDAFAGQYAQERQNQLNAMQLGQSATNAQAQGIGQARQAQLQAGQLGQQGTQMLMDNLSKERENQIRSMLFAPQMSSLDYQDISKLAEVGAQKEQLQQEQLAENIARYDYGQNTDAMQLAKFMNTIQGNYGGQSSGSSTSNLADGGGGNFLGSTMGLLGPLLFGGGGGLGGLFGGLLGF